MLDKRGGISLSETQAMVNSEEDSNLLNESIKCFLIEEEFVHSIKFSESEQKYESQFVFPPATKVKDLLSTFCNINAVKSTAKVITESFLEVNYNLDVSFCDTQDFKQSWRETKVPGQGCSQTKWEVVDGMGAQTRFGQKKK